MLNLVFIYGCKEEWIEGWLDGGWMDGWGDGWVGRGIVSLIMVDHIASDFIS